MAIVTAGVVREGMTSRIGIIGGRSAPRVH
jgi:hypothetical protein